MTHLTKDTSPVPDLSEIRHPKSSVTCKHLDCWCGACAEGVLLFLHRPAEIPSGVPRRGASSPPPSRGRLADRYSSSASALVSVKAALMTATVNSYRSMSSRRSTCRRQEARRPACQPAPLQRDRNWQRSKELQIRTIIGGDNSCSAIFI